MKLKHVAERLGCRLKGDGELEITGVAGIERAGPGELTFLSNPRYAKRAKETRAAAIIVEKEIPGAAAAELISPQPYVDFARALELFYQPPRPPAGIHPAAVIAESAVIGAKASIGPFAVIGERVTVGANAVIHPHVVIYEGVRIGDDFVAHSHAVVREFCEIGHRVVLQNGVIVGPDGFGFARQQDGSHYKIAQSGKTVIEDDVEIQANSCIDRAAVGETRIRRGTKIDNLVQIGHAVEVGEHGILCAQVGIAGSTTLGKNCILAGQVGLINHLSIGDNVVMTAQTGVAQDVPSGQKISGSPAIDNRRWLRSSTVFARLPELERRVREIGRKLGPAESKEQPPEN